MRFALLLVLFYEYFRWYYNPINHMYYEPWKFDFKNNECNVNIKHIIAIDFDNTIAYTKYPKIISEVPYAIDVLRVLSEDPRFVLILWTCREGDALKKALDFCKIREVHFDYVNENEDELIKLYKNDCRKIGADMYIDDKSAQTNVEKLWHDWYCWMKDEGII